MIVLITGPSGAGKSSFISEWMAADSRLAANTISTIYSGYLSVERNGAEVPVKAF